MVDWDYNAWGNKYPPFDLDEVVPTRLAEILKLPVFYPHMILEGGSIDVNGSGALLTSESCLLNKNRNPNLSRDEIEQRLRDYLGVSDILWLGDGIAGDDTDGHIDDLTRFVSERTVVTVVEGNRDDENYEPLQENLARLREIKIGGRKLDILTLPMPKKICYAKDCDSRRATRIFISQTHACSCPHLPIQTMKLHYLSCANVFRIGA